MLRRFLNKLFICAILVLVVLIGCKKNPSFKQKIYDNLYDRNISFAKFNMLYTKYLGPILPFKLDLTTKPVFNENLKYSNAEKYLDGVSLDVDNNYLVPSLSSGLVIFSGEKEEYGNTIIVMGEEGIETWYGNINNASVSMYDYIEKGSYIGDTLNNKLYLVFKQNGNVIDYEKYIK